MAQQVDREGVFRAEIKAYGLRAMESGSVCVTIQAALFHFWEGDAWIPWSEYDMEATGDIWIIKTDGTLNDGAAKSLINNAGWDGSIESIVNETWQPTPCQVTIKANEYKGQRSLKIAFVNDFDRTPGGLGNVDSDRAKAFQAKFGPSLRAMLGNAKRNTAPPAGKPKAPPLRVPETPATAGSGLSPSNGERDNEIPF